MKIMIMNGIKSTSKSRTGESAIKWLSPAKSQQLRAESFPGIGGRGLLLLILLVLLILFLIFILLLLLLVMERSGACDLVRRRVGAR